MRFKDWLESVGCSVEVTQPDDGGGYVCLAVRTPDGSEYDVTVPA